MDEPVPEELADPRFRQRFREAYRGRHDPEDVLRWLQDPSAVGRQGERSPRATLRGLAAAAYRPNPAAADLERLQQAIRVVEEDDRSVAAAAHRARETRDDSRSLTGGPSVERAPEVVRRPRRWGALVGIAVAVLVSGGAGYAAGAAAGTAPPPTSGPTAASERAQLEDRIATSDGALVAQDYYRLYPDELPPEWGGAATGTSFRELLGTEDLLVPVSPISRYLRVVVTCPAGDGGYRWSIAGQDTPRSGTCGHLEPQEIALPTRRARDRVGLRIAVDGTAGYGVSVLER